MVQKNKKDRPRVTWEQIERARKDLIAITPDNAHLYLKKDT